MKTPAHKDENADKGKMPPPLHMDSNARNERLYKHLLETGVFVEPVYSSTIPPRIDHLKVSAALPAASLAVAL